MLTLASTHTSICCCHLRVVQPVRNDDELPLGRRPLLCAAITTLSLSSISPTTSDNAARFSVAKTPTERDGEKGEGRQQHVHAYIQREDIKGAQRRTEHRDMSNTQIARQIVIPHVGLVRMLTHILRCLTRLHTPRERPHTFCADRRGAGPSPQQC